MAMAEQGPSPPVPNRVLWESLEPGTYEDMVAVLTSRLNPSAQRIDGSGGDGGRDVQVPTDDGLELHELKSFTGRMTSARRRQVENSLATAAQRDPVRWFLVVPIDPTPGELEWFESLTEAYGFECRWRGRSWLDSHMAQMPEVARYYAHGQRYESSEVVSLLRRLSAETPTVGEHFFTAVAEQVGGASDELNRLDPHYEFELSIQSDGQLSVKVIPRYPGAEQDRPWISARFDFGDERAGQDAERTFCDSLDYGTPSVVPSEFIADLTIDVPAGHVRSLEGYELAVGPAEPTGPVELDVALIAVEPTEGTAARLPLTQQEVTSGRRGVRITLRDKSGAVTTTLTFDANTRRFQMVWNYRQLDKFAPLELLPAAKFAAAIERGADVEIEFNGENLESDDETPPQAEIEGDGDASEFARLLEHLVNVQTRTGVFFDIEGPVTIEEARDIETASRLLNGDSVETTWDQMRLVIRPGGREPVSAAFGDPPAAMRARIGNDFTIAVQEVTVYIGYVMRTVESAHMHSWEEAPSGEPVGTTALILAPAESNRVTMQIEANDD